MKLSTIVSMPELSTSPASPTAGRVSFYAKADGLYYKDDAGVEVGPLGAAGGQAAAASTGLRLRHWRAAYANRHNARATIATIGDSIMEGTGVTAEADKWLARLVFSYNKNPDTLYRAAEHISTGLPAPFTVTGTVTSRNVNGIGIRARDIADGSSLTGTFEGDRVSVYYGKELGHGTMNITIDGVAYTGVSTANSTFMGGFFWDSPALARGTHTIVIAAAGGVVRFHGIKPYDGDFASGVHMFEGGRHGSRLADWRNDGFGGDVDPVAGYWPSDYGAVNPDLVIIGLLTNDYAVQTPISTYISGITSLITAVRTASATDPSFLLVAYPERSDTVAGETIPYSSYVTALSTIAGTDPDIDVLDVGKLMRTVATETDSMWADTVHPNAKGAQRISDVIVDGLDDVRDDTESIVSGPKSATTYIRGDDTWADPLNTSRSMPGTSTLSTLVNFKRTISSTEAGVSVPATLFVESDATVAVDHVLGILSRIIPTVSNKTYAIEGRVDTRAAGTEAYGVLGLSTLDLADNTGSFATGVRGRAEKGDNGTAGTGVTVGIWGTATGGVVNFSAILGSGVAPGDNSIVSVRGYVNSGEAAANIFVDDVSDSLVIDLTDDKLLGATIKLNGSTTSKFRVVDEAGNERFSASAAGVVTGVVEPYVMSVTGPLTVAAGKSRIYMQAGYAVESIHAAVNTAPTGAAVIVDVNKNGTTLFTTQTARPTIAVNGFSSTSTLPAVTTLAAGDYLTVDVDQVGSTVAGSDLTITIRLRRV